ncbi:uncharacterized protein AB675_7251 [Cyphellophora attinorum]|uniref:Uncharacterized protein n=1 Tax=Cyphellophora attinorum TaxID=1664694 RepID=A0A0N1NW77_9EURO|nr:uncharacterized protein AB675_7251 [Phialophora attinorum]KPI36330.1 hypothetical protein AB675_7251 [Phialophora attinorum]
MDADHLPTEQSAIEFSKQSAANETTAPDSTDGDEVATAQSKLSDEVVSVPPTRSTQIDADLIIVAYMLAGYSSQQLTQTFQDIANRRDQGDYLWTWKMSNITKVLPATLYALFFDKAVMLIPDALKLLQEATRVRKKFGSEHSQSFLDEAYHILGLDAAAIENKRLEGERLDQELRYRIDAGQQQRQAYKAAWEDGSLAAVKFTVEDGLWQQLSEDQKLLMVKLTDLERRHGKVDEYPWYG